MTTTQKNNLFSEAQKLAHLVKDVAKDIYDRDLSKNDADDVLDAEFENQRDSFNNDYLLFLTAVSEAKIKLMF